MNDSPKSVFVVGDVHGQLGKLLTLLRDIGLTDESYDWCGEDASLIFVGDYVNRGPSGLDVVNLIRHLQDSSRLSKGKVIALLGNHDVCQLAAKMFLENSDHGPEFLRAWIDNGGHAEDITRMDEQMVGWFQVLPALAVVDDALIMHADSDFYLTYGGTVESINQSVSQILSGCDAPKWQALQRRFSDRHVFDDTRPGGRERAKELVRHFGAVRLIHGHTPIDKVTNEKPDAVRSAFVYNKGLCTNVDGGMYRGGPGFVVSLAGGESTRRA